MERAYHLPGPSQMARLKFGDRVELTGDIARFHKSNVGIIIDAEQRNRSALKEFAVQLADGNCGVFFDFQLQIPPISEVQLAYDSASSSKPPGLRGGAGDGRQLRFISSSYDIHFSISTSQLNQTFIIGQVIGTPDSTEPLVVSLLVGDSPISTIFSNIGSEFRLRDAPSGPVAIEVVVPSCRIVSEFVI